MSNTEQMVSELLPCPFCKASMRIESNQDWHRVMGEHDEECVFLDPETMMVPATDEQRELLVRDWNRRAQSPAQRQGEPVAWYRENAGSKFLGFNPSHPDCQPLYTHADPGEVERLQRQVKNAELALKVQAQNCDTLREENKRRASACGQTVEEMSSCEAENERLRTQLAERDALLRDINKRHSSGVDFDLPADLAARVAALSASAEPSAREAQALKDESRLGIERLPAEPSAPVELDEQAEFMAWANKEYEVAPDEELNLKNPSVRDNKIGWLARAALERKP